MSSTQIREKVRNGQDLTDFLTQEVIDYIKEKRLYL